ncbi:protein phosphatase 2C domain-containing protein [Actinocorallia sp. API 0066]|uniref:protein phosphatase 2C domain-containing protein n=1 Tax=Actinocorallia sp. API 0066 TaxID=2896846 RepID=UPI001E582609|nr:protein phosphatase 2C domain-containing protein [Actinocorallia sp. API 0066]MCD0452418.1 protein phosphatase 2C domain-containing protein [Actinocorallia sp. API 0066]
MRVSVSSLPGRPDRPNEDFAAIGPGTAVLIDGAGAPSGLDSGCVHSVAWYARTLGGLLLAELADPGVGLAEALEGAIKRVVEAHGETCDLTNPHSPSATVLAVRARGDALEYLALADSTVIIEFHRGEPLIVTDDRLEDVRGRVLGTAADSARIGADGFADGLLARMERMAAHRNVTGGFWVASTHPDAAREAVVGAVPLVDVKTVTLLTDGATRLVDLFGVASWAELLHAVACDGPDTLIDWTRDVEAADPDGARCPRGKAHDDATVIRWNLSD